MLIYFDETYDSNHTYLVLENIKKARADKKYAEMLISSNTKHTVNGVLLTDELTRCNGDEFIEKMKETFCIPGSEFSWGKKDPTLKDVMDVRSDKEEYQVMQRKNEIRKYLLKNLGISTLKETYWSQFKRWESEDNHPKFNVWYWKPKESK